MDTILTWVRDYLLARFIADPLIKWADRKTKVAREWILLLTLFHTRRLGSRSWRRRVEIALCIRVLPIVIEYIDKYLNRRAQQGSQIATA